MATIAVVTSSPPFAEGGHLVMARELVRALREEGHDTGLVVTPQNRFGQQGERLSGGMVHRRASGARREEGRSGDQPAVSRLRGPASAIMCCGSTTACASTTICGIDFSSHLTWKSRSRKACAAR